MLIDLLVRLLGGIWKLKEKCNRLPTGYYRKYLIKLYRAYQFNHGASIAWNSHFHGVPCLPHGLHGIFIAATARVGKNCVIFHQVTIGANTIADSKGVGAPTIGENCYIGAGAKIIGNVNVGNNVRIGANCVVYQDVPDNSVVVMSGQLIKERETKNVNRFHVYKNNLWMYYDDEKWVIENDEKVMNALKFCVKAFEK